MKTTARSVLEYSTRIRPSVTRERYFQYVRARRSRCIGDQIASSSAAGIVRSAAWTEWTAPCSSNDVCLSGSRITASATGPSRDPVSSLIGRTMMARRRSADAQRADAVREGEVERLRGRGGEVPAEAAAVRAAVDDRHGDRAAAVGQRDLGAAGQLRWRTP